MTTLLSIFVATSLYFTGATTLPLATETAIIAVQGNCSMCKQRIETAARVRGVSTATWDAATDKLTVRFNPVKVTLANIEAAVAKAGYDTQNVRAADAAYNVLPHCCHYRE